VSESGGTREPVTRRLGTAAGYLALFAASWVVASVAMGNDLPVVGIVLLVVAAAAALVLRRAS
jgi:hypothetical protein